MVSLASRKLWAWVAVLALGALSGCGGGGGSTTEPPPPVCQPIMDSAGNAVPCTAELWAGGGDGAGAAGADGSAGDGAAIVGATVRLTDANGKTASGVTDAQGYYRLNITGMAAPFVLKLTLADGTERHHSFSLQSPKLRGFITINLTGLTDKLASDVAVAAGKSGAKDLTPAILSANPGAVTAARNSLNNAIKPQIEAAGLSISSFDPIGVFFRPNLTGYDLVLETVAVYIDASGATQIVGKPQTACTLPGTWAVGGNACAPASNPGFLASGSSVKLTDSAGPLVGAIEYSCANQVLSVVGTPTCATEAQPSPCTAPASNWAVGNNSCSSDIAPTSIASGARLTLTDSSSPVTGSITYSCTNGALSVAGSPTCATVALGCSAPSANWIIGGNTCTSNTAPSAMSSGGTVTLSDTIDPTRGSINYLCSNGTLSVTGTPTCTMASGACAAPASTWTVAGEQCQSETVPGPMGSGATLTLSDSTSPATGSITYRCDNGTLSLIGSPTCASPITGCSAPPSSWTVGPTTCNADTTPAPLGAGQSVTLIDTQGLTTGSSSWTCSDGSLFQLGTPSCAQATVLACSPPSAYWIANGNSCMADSLPSTIPSGTTVTLIDSVPTTTGTISYTCNNGTLTPSNASCNVPPPTPCDTSKLPSTGWSVDSLTCYPDSAPASIGSGVQLDVRDTVSPYTGSASFLCQSGTLLLLKGATCGRGL